jgi:hypothetical protein
VRLRRGERPLASARTQDGQPVEGYRDRLQVGELSLAWQDILRAEWDAAASQLTLVLAEGDPVTLTLEDAALLLQLVRERISASVVSSRRVELDGRRGFTLMVRRPPSGGEIRVLVEYDPGIDPDDPAVTNAARQAHRALRQDLGI